MNLLVGLAERKNTLLFFLRGRAQWKRPGVTLASAVRPYLRRTSLAADAFFMASDAACRKSAAQNRRKNKHRSPGNERRRSAWPFACSTRPVGGVFAAVASLASGRPGFESRQTAAEMPARPAAVRDIHTFDAFMGCGEKKVHAPVRARCRGRVPAP